MPFDSAAQGLRKSVFGMLGMSILTRLDSGHMCTENMNKDRMTKELTCKNGHNLHIKAGRSHLFNSAA